MIEGPPPLPCPICWSSEDVDGYSVNIQKPGEESEPYEGFWCQTCDLIFETDDVQEAGLVDSDGNVLHDLRGIGHRVADNGVVRSHDREDKKRRNRRRVADEEPSFGKVEREDSE